MKRGGCGEAGRSVCGGCGVVECVVDGVVVWFDCGGV